jgi:hypothetical protein
MGGKRRAGGGASTREEGQKERGADGQEDEEQLPEDEEDEVFEDEDDYLMVSPVHEHVLHLDQPDASMGSASVAITTSLGMQGMHGKLMPSTYCCLLRDGPWCPDGDKCTQGETFDDDEGYDDPYNDGDDEGPTY